MSCIDMTFETFLGEINIEVPEKYRKLFEVKEVYEHPICARFEKTAPVPESVRTMLSRDFQYISKDYKPTTLTPKQFYRGYSRDWSPVVHNYDFRRDRRRILIQRSKTITKNTTSVVVGNNY